MDKELLIVNEQRKWFLEIELIPGEDVFVKLVKMTRDLGYYLSLVDKTVAWFERIDSNSERSSAVGKMLSSVNQCGKPHFCFTLRNCHSRLSLYQSPP